MCRHSPLVNAALPLLVFALVAIIPERAEAQNVVVQIDTGASRPGEPVAKPHVECGLRTSETGPYVPGPGTNVVPIDVESGKRGAPIKLGPEKGFSWLVHLDGTLVAGLTPELGVLTKRVVGVDLARARVIWQRTDLPSLYATNLSGHLIVVNGKQSIAVLDVRTGETLASAPSAGNSRRVCRGWGGSHFVTTSGNIQTGWVHRIDPATGAILWSHQGHSLDMELVDKRYLVSAETVPGTAAWQYGVELVVLRLDSGKVYRRHRIPDMKLDGDFWGAKVQYVGNREVAVEGWSWVE